MAIRISMGKILTFLTTTEVPLISPLSVPDVMIQCYCSYIAYSFVQLT